MLGTLFLLSCGDTSKKISENNSVLSGPLKLPYIFDIERSLKKDEPILLSNIGKELEYIPLETNPNSLMGQILRIQFTSDFIFVAAYPSKGLLQFDRNGKFIKQIGSQGRGPGEYIGGSMFCIDEKSEKIFIMSCWSNCEILEYNFNGEYIKSYNQPYEVDDFLVYDTIGFVFKIADYYPPAANVTPGAIDHSFLENNLIITDFTSNQLLKIKRYFIRNSNLGGNAPAFYFLNNKLHYQQFGVDTLYILNNNKLNPYIVFDLGKKKMDPNLVFTQSNFDDVNKKIENDLWIRTIVENKNNLFVKLNLGLSDSSKYCIYNTQTSQTTMQKGVGIKNDLDEGPDFWPKYVFKDSILVDYIDANKFVTMIHDMKFKKLKNMNASQNERLISLTETSNPILMILK